MDSLGLVALILMTTGEVSPYVYVAGVVYQMTLGDNGAADKVTSAEERAVFLQALCDTGDMLVSVALHESPPN